MSGNEAMIQQQSASAIKSKKLGKSHSKDKILLVEDDKINQLVMVEILKTFGWSADVASNGKEALLLYQRIKHTIIFMDVGLPDYSGIEVTKLIRQQNDTSPPKIIAVTAFGDIIKEACDEAGMDEFLTKPIDRSIIGKVLEKYITYSEGAEV